MCSLLYISFNLFHTLSPLTPSPHSADTHGREAIWWGNQVCVCVCVCVCVRVCKNLRMLAMALSFAPTCVLVKRTHSIAREHILPACRVGVFSQGAGRVPQNWIDSKRTHSIAREHILPACRVGVFSQGAGRVPQNWIDSKRTHSIAREHILPACRVGVFSQGAGRVPQNWIGCRAYRLRRNDNRLLPSCRHVHVRGLSAEDVAKATEVECVLLL